MGGTSAERSNSESVARQDFQGLRHVPEGSKQEAISRAREEEMGQRVASGAGLRHSATIPPSLGGFELRADVLHEHVAAECKELEEVFFRLQGVESALASQRLSRGAARGLRWQAELLKGRQAFRALLREAELCVPLQKNVQQFRARTQALVSGGRMRGRELGGSEDGLVLVDAAALCDARDAAESVQQAVRDAITVAVRRAEERVHCSWERAWGAQKAQLRRVRARPLMERMRSVRGLGRRAQALGGRCHAACNPLLEARSRGEALTWNLVAPLVEATEGLAREADALSVRASQVCAAIGRPAEDAIAAPSEECCESSPEWQEWEADASLARGGRFGVGPGRAPGELVSLRPTAVTVRLQAAVRGWMVRRRARATVDEEDGGSASDDDGCDDEYASAEEEAAEAREGGEEESREGESRLLVWGVGAGAKGGASWPRADVRASGDG